MTEERQQAVTRRHGTSRRRGMKSARRTVFTVGVAVGVVASIAVAFLVWPDGGDSDGDSGVRGGDAEAASDSQPVAAGELDGVEAPEVPVREQVDLPELDLSAANRREPVAGLPDWSHAGYRGTGELPAADDITGDDACVITADELTGDFGVSPDGGDDDTAGIQEAIDTIRDDCSPDASYEELSLIELPQGLLDVSRQISVDADYLIIRGAGSDPVEGTRIVFRPDENTAYDSVADGDWDEDGMEFEDGQGGWLWPGRGLFRVQSREVHEDYQEAYESAPDNRRDLFEGTVNVHWKAGADVAEADGGDGFAARVGDTEITLADDADVEDFAEGTYVNVRAANTMSFYEDQQALPTEHELQNLHMRQQIFTVTAVDEDSGTITLDHPLEYDVPVDSTSDGSEEIEGDSYESRVSPLVDPVVGVGFEAFHFGQVVPDATPEDAVHEYGNLAPAYEMHGIVFKWAVDSWVRDTASYMTGSHPVVTEEARNLQIVDNYFDGAWNKGKGGNGYLRGSRVWDSIYAGNVLRNLRHFTFQWSASGNVFAGNDTDADLNLHGGWERNNLFELNNVHVPYDHRPGRCTANCGGEGGATEEDESLWYPLWWGAGQKAVKWSGATGPHNVLYGNTMTKVVEEGGDPVPYMDVAEGTIVELGWDGEGYQHLLDADGEPIPDWAGHETDDYTGGRGVVTDRRDPGPSLFLRAVG
jgi:hypothetical protein